MNSDTSPDAAAATVTPTAEGCEIALFSSILGLSTRFPVSEQFGERAAEPPRSPAVRFGLSAAIRPALSTAEGLSPVTVS